MLKENLTQLIDIATSDNRTKDVIDARKEYQSIAGNIYEDDKSYENRMALFLEWYIFDRIFPNTNQTLLETLIQKNKENLPSNLLQIFKEFTTNIHGLFIVKKIREHSVKVMNLFDNVVYEANESLPRLLFRKNSIFEGRLVYHDNMYSFTGSFCFHPEKSKNFIKQEIKPINAIIHKHRKELKNRTVQLNSEKKNLHKVISKIDKLKPNLQKSYPENKISKIKKNLAELETMRSDLERKYSYMESEVKIFISEKTIRGPKALQTGLIQRLSFMQLVWERSRLIELSDIYHN